MNELSPITVKLMEVSNEIAVMQGLSEVDHCLKDEALEGVNGLLDDIDKLRDATIQEAIDTGARYLLGDREEALLGQFEGREEGGLEV